MAESPTTRSRSSTRDRILTACRRLFNEQGAGAVTTAEIAQAVGINEGNLYYHFQRKEQIVLALFEWFEVDLAGLAERERRPQGEGRPYAGYLLAFFELVWEWRFLYRDALALIGMAPTLRAAILAHSRRNQDDVKRSVRKMVAEGWLDVPEDRIDTLAVNAWLVSTYWLDYLQFHQGVRRITKAHLRLGCDQVASLYDPYRTTPRGAGTLARTAAEQG